MDAPVDRIAREIERQQSGASPAVLYSPEHGANGHVAGGKFVPHGVPAGFELDLDAWKAQGEDGPAPLKPAEQEETDG